MSSRRSPVFGNTALKARLMAKKVIIAVGHAILTMIYHMLKRRVIYQELRSTYFDEHGQQAVENI